VRAAQAVEEGRSRLLGCPVCGSPLTPQNQAFTCINSHTFDIAREGYVNLLLAQHRNSRDPGHSKEMIAGRREFLAAGHYRPLADGISDAILSYLPGSAEQAVLDAGCGEGYYLRQLRNHLEGRNLEQTTMLGGLDISKHAIHLAAKRDPRGLYAVASVYGMPILPGRVDVLLSHFSPVSAEDFKRVVHEDGVVLIGGPGERHLFELKELLYNAAVEHRPADPLLGASGFKLIETRRIQYEVALRGRAQVAQLLLMTPFYWSVSRETQETIAGLDSLNTEVDVIVHAYRRVPNAGGEKSTL
jgi:23S rRNA (guanine745-N1)-methyltransferase